MKKLFLTLIALTVISISPAFAGHHSMNGQTIFVDVNGLVCDFCARAVEKVFMKQAAVENIDVDLNEKVITVTFKEDQSLSHDVIEELITSSGYDLVGIRHSEQLAEHDHKAHDHSAMEKESSDE